MRWMKPIILISSGPVQPTKNRFSQEFCCVPADDNTAFLPYDLITGCEYKEGEPWKTDLLDCKNPLFIGVDIGREHDLTCIWLIEQVNDIRFTRRVIELSKQTFEAQEHALYDLLETAQRSDAAA